MEKSFFLLSLLLFCVLVEDVVSRRIHHGRFIDDRDKGNKIVGGNVTSIYNYPYQVYLLLQKSDKYYECGGSIISERFVLTAAHCLSGITQIYVRAGSTMRNVGGTQYNTTRYRQHPYYDPMNSDYDVGLVHIPDGITINGRSTRIVKLPAAGSTIENGTEILVSGWGDTTENGQDTDVLMAVQIPTVSNEDCRKSYPSLTVRQFCAGLPEGGKDSCQGDSGGPAVDSESGIQLGIVSYGKGCARPGYPGVYTNVAKVRRWITLYTGV